MPAPLHPVHLRPRCPGCGYPLFNSAIENSGEQPNPVVCPECGERWSTTELTEGRRPRWWVPAFFIPAAICPCLVTWILVKAHDQLWSWFKGDLVPGDIRNNAAGDQMRRFVNGVFAYGIPVLTIALLALGLWCALSFGRGGGRARRLTVSTALTSAAVVAILAWGVSFLAMVMTYWNT